MTPVNSLFSAADFSGLPDDLQRALLRLGISTPTPVQTKTLGPALDGKDVLGSAPTGTGKTLAFLLPLCVFLTQKPSENALILSPTRELAEQTYRVLLQLLPDDNSFPPALIIGGDNIHKQYAALRKKPRVIVATPGRLLDHITRKSVDLKHTHFLVLDETDRMLDMGFIDDMRAILAHLPAPRQTLLFSATVPTEIEALAREFLTDPVRVRVGAVQAPAAEVLQEIVRVDIREKLPQLLHELQTCGGPALVFVNTQRGAERLAKQLKQYGQKAACLHGELGQNRRRQVLDFFKSGTLRVLVATDLAARGIDVADIACVVNYDLPFCAEDFVHRTGRTGRAGRIGRAVSLITDEAKWREICRITKFETPVKEVQKTIKPLPQPKFVATGESAVRPKKSARKENRVRENVPSKTVFEKPALSSPVVPSSAVPQKPKTFKKAVEAARLMDSPAEPFAPLSSSKTSFKKVKVGASRRALKKQVSASNSRRKNSAPQKPFSSFFKRKKRRR